MIYKDFVSDDMQFLTELMIYKAFALIGFRVYVKLLSRDGFVKKSKIFVICSGISLLLVVCGVVKIIVDYTQSVIDFAIGFAVTRKRKR